MEIKFFVEDKVLDLSGQKISVQDSNSRMSDKMFSKYMFPFEIYMNEEFKTAFGDYESEDSFGLENKFEGLLLFEHKIHKAKLQLLTIENNYLTGQIDFGFEDLPNFNKKLAELPLEKFPVTDIYTFAKDICAKKYPQTNFNFPRLYTDKYSPDQEVWSAFDGYYNDLKPDGTEMRRNFIDETGNIFNVDIIHPLPHTLYVLKTGFADAGLKLQGDILEDPVLAQRWIFSGTEYFTSKQQRRFDWKFSSMEYEEVFLVHGAHDYAKYEKYISLEKTGKYKIAGILTFFKAKLMLANYVISLNGQPIWSKFVGANSSTIVEQIPLNIDFNVTQENSELQLFIYTQYHPDYTMQMADLLVTSDALQDIDSNSLGDDSGVVTNLNEVDLTRAVPDMTFGDFINILRNWFNYDLDVIDNVVFMNKIGIAEPSNIKNFEKFEVKSKKRNLLQKKSFLLRPVEYDKDGKPDSMFYDKDGAVLNKSPLEDTTIIEINGYALPVGVPKPNGYNTAIVKKDSSDCLQLVYYDGLTDGQNNAKNPPGCNFPELFYSNWQKWLRQRINGTEYNWKFKCLPEEFYFSIKNYIFCYKNIHNIKSWTKDIIGDSYEIDITTETVN